MSGADLTVAICTFRRPDGLRATLRGLGACARLDGVSIEVLVIDNDPDGSAAWAEREGPELCGFPLRYVHEPAAGLTHARNRAIEESPGVRALVFLDDDEIPRPGWLAAFWGAHLAHPDDVHIGPVISVLSVPLPAWADERWPFGRPEHPDGAVIPNAGDGNALLPRSVLADPGLRYDHTFAFTGGQDTDLFRRVQRAGHRLRWAAHATVDETIPDKRTELAFTLHRTERGATSYAYLVRSDGPFAVANRLLAVVRDGLVGAGLVLLGAFRRDASLSARGRNELVRARGTINGLRGHLKSTPTSA